MEAKVKDAPYCCATKFYHCTNNSFVDTLSIIPRVVICKSPLNVSSNYEQDILIQNCGVYPRSIKYHTDSFWDTTFHTTKLHGHFLEPDKTLKIRVEINPQKSLPRQNINRRRNIFIESEHPNIIYEVPIIVLAKCPNPSFPKHVTFPRGMPSTKSFYEFVVYNPSHQAAALLVKSACHKLKIKLSNKVVEKKDYLRVLLTLHVQDMKPINDLIKLKFMMNPYVTIEFQHEPRTPGLFVGSSHVFFEEVKFKRELTKHFRVCNESSTEIKYNVEFLTEETNFEDMSEYELITQRSIDTWFQPETAEQVPPQSKLLQVNSDEEYEVDAETICMTKLSSDDDRIFVPAAPDPPYEQKFSDTEASTSEDNQNDLTAYKHFALSKTNGVLGPKSSDNFIVIFRPQKNLVGNLDNDLKEPPYILRTKIYFTTMDQDNILYRTSVTLVGTASGPEIEFTPNLINLHKVYLGEEQSEVIKVRNKDELDSATIHYKNYSNKAMGNVRIVPTNRCSLEPNQTTEFHLYFYTSDVGKFFVKLKFKVRRGHYYYVVVKGTSQPVRIRTFPDIIELGSIPFAIPQKRMVLVMNPLSVPLTVQFLPPEDGIEVPLVLEVDDVDKILPITVKDPIKEIIDLQQYREEAELNSVRLTDSESPLGSFRSAKSSDSDTSYSTSFEEAILDPMPNFANVVIRTIKETRAHEKTEAEKRVLNVVVQELLNTKYFNDLRANSSYIYMDWNAIPSYPKELYCDAEIIYLKPNTGRTITMVLIPNTLGYHNRTLNIRVCPVQDFSKREDDRENIAYINSKLMMSKLWMEYNCRVPEFIYNELTTLDGEDVYSGQEYEFPMEFENREKVAGFLHFDVIPDCADGVMWFTDQNWKFYVEPESTVIANCAAMFRKYGDITLRGLIKYVGNLIGKSYRIQADVLPIRVGVTPSCLYKRQRVLELTRVYIYIENLTPTVTWLTFALKNNDYNQLLEPLGTILAPTGQGMYVCIHTTYSDPELIKNVLHIQNPYGISVNVPITFNIEGMPIFFDPDITIDGWNAGLVFVNSEENFRADIPNYSKDIKVINRGARVYRLTITKVKTGPNTISKCAVPVVKAHISISPKVIVIQPGTEQLITVTANACEVTTVHNEFRIQIVDQMNKQRFQNLRLVVTAQFVQPELHWSRKEICMDYYRTHPFKEHPQLELVHLSNIADVPIESVHLKLSGPFQIKELFEHHFSKELKTSMQNLEKKQLTVMLNKSILEKTSCDHLDGRVVCMADGRCQKSLPLKVHIFNPILAINQPDLILFTEYSERDVNVLIENVGCVAAEYKWKKLQEYREYVAEYDLSYDYAQEILSDLFYMLDFAESEKDSIDETNLTTLYQKYRCKLTELKDPIGVHVIIDDIIDGLDLEHKRYALKLFNTCCNHFTSFTYSDQQSTNSFIHHTVDKVLDKLNLEDSYDVSEPSCDDCNMQRTVFFYEKRGTLQQNEAIFCRLHLPAVRTGYMLKAIFELVVVGGASETFQITLLNLATVIRLSRDSIYLGMKPWYELYNANIRVFNVTQFDVNLRLEELSTPKKRCHRFPDGYVKIASDKLVYMTGLGKHLIKTEGILGFCEEFSRLIKVVINDGEEQHISLRGQGVMPLLLVINKLNRLEDDPEKIVESYQLLQRIYYFDVFRGITEEDEELPCNEERPCHQENPLKVETRSTFSSESSDNILTGLIKKATRKSTSAGSSSLASSASMDERSFFRLMKTYVLINNNEELPNSMVLEQLLETQRFIGRVSESAETCTLLNMVYRHYVKMRRTSDEKRPLNLKHFTVQPLPFELTGYVYNMEELKLGQYRKIEINLQFFGPGKLIAAARTVVKIPGLVVDFIVDDSEDGEFQYFVLEEDSGDFIDKPYRNMYEREIDLETVPKLKHAHSFDVDMELRHLRAVPTKDRKNVQNYYNSLNKSVYPEHKHHVVLCKICSNSKKNFSDTNLRVVVLFKPEAIFFTIGQLLEDFLYIDLHMGPTVPILLRGLLTDN